MSKTIFHFVRARRIFPQQLAHIQFNGLFQRESVTWDTHFFTLSDYSERHNHDENIHKQFIDIETIGSNNLKLTIALKYQKLIIKK